MNLPAGKEIVDLVTALAPGLVILGIRQWFIAAPLPKLEDRAFAYAAVSILYFALATPLIAVVQAKATVSPLLLYGLEYLIIPSAIGFALGIATITDLADHFWSLCRISPFHHAPTAWDYAFTRLKSVPFVLVTLTDGSQVSGRYGRGSFAASSNDERDLLICDVYDHDLEPWAIVEPHRSILLCGRDIRFVEFFKEPSHGKQTTTAPAE